MDSCCIKPTNNMKKIIQHIVLVLLFFQACAQPVENAVSNELKIYNFVNLPEGITNFQYKVYPENTIILSGVYQDISEAKNESIIELITSSLSENSLEWYKKNRDYEDDRTNEYIQKVYNKWLEKKHHYRLMSMMTYDYQNNEFAVVIMEVYSDGLKMSFINSFGCIRKNNQWYITESDPSSMNRFIIGNMNIHPHSAYNIYNKNPQNEGEHLLLAQSLNEKGELDFERLSAALYTIQEQAAENEDIRKILLIEDFE